MGKSEAGRQSQDSTGIPGKILVALTVICWLALTQVSAQRQSSSVVRVACVGASTTYGATLENKSIESFPAQLQKLLGANWDVRNFGVNGAGVLEKGEIPYRKTGAYRATLQFLPDIVLINLGVNDVKPPNWQYKADFMQDYEQLIAVFKKLPSHPKIYICREIPVFKDQWGIRARVVLKELYPLKKRIARKQSLPILDLYTPLLGKAALFTDGVHPNKAGAALMAKIIAGVLVGYASRPIPREGGY